MLSLSLFALSTALLPLQDMTPPAPAQLSQLKWMEGSFAGKMEMTMGPGMTAMASLAMKGAMKGQFLELEYSTEMEGLPHKITEKGFLGWDAESGRYRMWSFTSVSSAPRIEAGKFENGILSMVSEPWAATGPAKEVFRSQLEPVEGGIRFTLEIKAGEEFMRVGSTIMKRQSAS